MLSREIETTLGGRYISVHVFPYDYKEFLNSKSFKWTKSMLYSSKDKKKILDYFDEFMNYGGFPEVSNLVNKREYLSSIYNKIFLGDIIARHSLTNVKALEIMMKKLAESVGQTITFSRLTNIIKSVGISVGKSTIIQYLEYSKESYLIFSINNFASKIVEKTTSPKYYFVDSGLLNLFVYDADSALFENLVASFLIRKYGQENVYYYLDGVEVDFYIPSESLAVQVSYSISETKTRERELKALLKLGEHQKIKQKMIITYEEEEIIDINNTQVQVVPAYKWMLGEKGIRKKN